MNQRRALLPLCSFVVLMSLAAGPLVRTAWARSPVQAGRRIVVVVVADTLDPVVGDDMKVNARSIESYFKACVPARDLTLEFVTGQAYTYQQILDRIARVPVGPDDALAVFMMGHGSYDPQRGSYFLMLKGRQLLRSTVRATIDARGARFTGYLTDSCNAFRPLKNVMVGPEKAMPSAQAPAQPIEWDPGCSRLFREGRGVVDLASCSPGEFSLCYPTIRFLDERTRRVLGAEARGSLFTQALIESMMRANGTSTWDEVEASASERTAGEFADLFPRGIAPRIGGGNINQATQTVNPVALRVAFPDPKPESAIPDLPNRLGTVVVPSTRGIGVRVTQVRPGSIGARDGFAAGDEIERIGTKVVKTPEEFAKLLEDAGDLVQLSGRNPDGSPFHHTYRLSAKPRANADGPVALRFDVKPRVEPPPLVRTPPEAGTWLEPLGAWVTEGADGLSVVRAGKYTVAAAYNYLPGDTVRELDGKEIRTVADFRQAYEAAQKPTLIAAGINRSDGQPYRFEVDFVGPLRMRLGLYYDSTPTRTPGARIRSISPNFPAAEHGLKPGDAILSMNGVPIQDWRQAEAVLARSSRTVRLVVRDAATGEEVRHEIQLAH